MVLIVIAGAVAVSYFRNSGNLPSFLRSLKLSSSASVRTPSALTREVQYEQDTVVLNIPNKWRNADFGVPRELTVPKGWKAELFVSGVPSARFFSLRDDGVIFLSLSKEGRVVALPDDNKDGVADTVVTVLSGLDYPHGLVWNNGWLYVAETTRIMRYKDLNGDYIPDLTQGVVSNLPAGGNHISRSIAIGPDNMLYVSVGSSCNVCVDDPHRAAILRYTLNGEKEETYATGLRNAVGIVFNPQTGDLLGTDNGRDFLGDNEPPDEVNIIKEGANYGWPACFGDKRQDPDLKPSADYCANTESPYLNLPAHSAPLGLGFLSGNKLPADYKGSLLVAFHGSWNRSAPTGYKVIRARVTPTGESVVDDFASGWLVSGAAWGRPVDVIQGADGAVYVSDDSAGAVYRFEPPANK